MQEHGKGEDEVSYRMGWKGTAQIEEGGDDLNFMMSIGPAQMPAPFTHCASVAAQQQRRSSH